MDLYASEYKIPMLGTSKSDAYVFDEIYGAKDSYQKDRLLPIIKNGEVIEIGAHKGYFSLLAGTVAKRIVSFEPSDVNFNFLKKNIDLNNYNHITPVKKAVANDSDPKIFTLSNKTDARHSLLETEYSGCERKVQVLCTSIPEIIIDYSIHNTALLKLDCEGGEYDILMNLSQDIASYIPRIICEIHEAPNINYCKEDLIFKMKSLGYSVEIYSERSPGNMKFTMAWFSR